MIQARLILWRQETHPSIAGVESETGGGGSFEGHLDITLLGAKAKLRDCSYFNMDSWR